MTRTHCLNDDPKLSSPRTWLGSCQPWQVSRPCEPTWMTADVCREGLCSRCSGCFWMSVSGTLEADILGFAGLQERKKKHKNLKCHTTLWRRKDTETSSQLRPCFDIYSAANRRGRPKTVVPDNPGPTRYSEHCSSDGSCSSRHPPASPAISVLPARQHSVQTQIYGLSNSRHRRPALRLLLHTFTVIGAPEPG